MNNRLIVMILTLHAPGIHSMEGEMRDSEGQFNYFVSIWHNCARLCSGILIHKRHVLTTAHCLHDITIPRLSVLVGVSNTENSTNEGVKAVHSVWLHPYSTSVFKPLKPNNYYWSNDIAVIKLKDELIESTTIGFAPVVTNDLDWYGLREFTMLGWRHDLMALFQGMTFGWTRGIIISELDCLKKKTSLLSNERCINAPVILEQDEGSPLIYNDAVIGIIVSGGLAFGEPVTVLPIAPYMDFIKSVMLDGRTDAYHDEFRYTASIWYYGHLQCGGTIVDSFHIVTTAMCLNGIQQSLLKVVVGKSEAVSYLDLSIEWLEVDGVVRHPSFKEYWIKELQPDHMIFHNIAVLRLKRPLVWSTTVGRASILRAINPGAEICYHAVQFEMSTIGDIATYVKLKLSSAIIESAESRKINLLDNQFVLVGANMLPVSNIYDHGNPVVSNGLVIGIVAQTLEIYAEFSYKPTIVLSIHHYIDFIKFVISGSSFP